MWQRYNGTTKIFEKSTNDGASWSALGLDCAILTQGVLSIQRADGVADNVYVADFRNMEATAGRSFGLFIQAGSNGNDSVIYTRNVSGADLFRVSGDGKLYERGRTTPMGEWIPIAYVGAYFTASSGTWVVDSGDMTAFSYMLVGKTMSIYYEIDTTTVTGTPSQLRIAIPAGFTAAKGRYVPFMYNDNGAGWICGAGTAFTQAGLPFIALQLGSFGVSTWANSTNGTYVRGIIDIEVQ